MKDKVINILVEFGHQTLLENFVSEKKCREALSAILSLFKKSLPEKLTEEKTSYGLKVDPYVTGFNKAIDEMRKKLGEG